jgi:hypothetical protein
VEFVTPATNCVSSASVAARNNATITLATRCVARDNVGTRRFVGEVTACRWKAMHQWMLTGVAVNE